MLASPEPPDDTKPTGYCTCKKNHFQRHCIQCGKEYDHYAKFPIEQVRLWGHTHGLADMSDSDMRAAFEDARTMTLNNEVSDER